LLPFLWIGKTLAILQFSENVPWLKEKSKKGYKEEASTIGAAFRKLSPSRGTFSNK